MIINGIEVTRSVSFNATLKRIRHNCVVDRHCSATHSIAVNLCSDVSFLSGRGRVTDSHFAFKNNWTLVHFCNVGLRYSKQTRHKTKNSSCPSYSQNVISSSCIPSVYTSVSVSNCTILIITNLNYEITKI